MAIRTRAVPDKAGRDETVEAVERLMVGDPRIRPHVERIFIDSDDKTSFELYLDRTNTFALVAMYRDHRLVPEVQADQGWALEMELVRGKTVTLRFDAPVLDRESWPIRRIEISRGRPGR